MFQAKPDDSINKITVRHGSVIDSVQFTTDKGDNSAKFGGPQGGNISEFKTSGRITGVKFNGGQLVDGFSVVANE